MADLIDRAALMKEIQKIGGNPWSEWETAGVVNLVCRQQTVDAVEVVRCKDCKYYNKQMPGENECCTINAEYDEDVGVWYGLTAYTT